MTKGDAGSGGKNGRENGGNDGNDGSDGQNGGGDDENGRNEGDDGDYPSGLTRNESLVWDALNSGEEPLKAYEILDQLKEKGVRAPMTVYRALDGLEEKGLIHKLEGLNSFVLCNHEGPHQVQTFLVCEKCAGVQEVDLDGVEPSLTVAIKRADFAMHTARLEVKGRCAKCQENENGP